MPEHTNRQHNKPLAVAYLRGPDSDQREPALAHQRDNCPRTAARLGAQLVAEYVDIGSSAAPQRPGLDSLLTRLTETPPVLYVIVANLDRLTRRHKTLLAIVDTIIANGAVLVDAHHIYPSEQGADSGPVVALRSYVGTLLAACSGEIAARRRRAALMPVQGTRVVLVSTADPHTNLQPGTKGTVRFADSTGTVHVRWDDGSRLGLIPGEDVWEALR